MIRWRWLLLVLVLGGCAGRQKPSGPWVRKLTIEGVKHLQVRILRYYQAHGYFNAEIAYTKVEKRKGNSVEVIIGVEEGLPTLIDEMKLDGRDELDEQSLREVEKAELELRRGQTFVHERYLHLKDSILGTAKERGYAFAELDGNVTVDKSRNIANVELELAPGPQSTIGTIEVVPMPAGRRRRNQGDGSFRLGEITAESRIPAYLAGLVLSGDPGASGISPSGLQGQAFGALSTMIVNRLRQNLIPELPIDVLRFGNTQSGVGGAGAQIEVGKYLTEKLYIGYAYQIGNDRIGTRRLNRNEARLAYRLGRQWQAEASFGDAGAGGLDFYWTWRPGAANRQRQQAIKEEQRQIKEKSKESKEPTKN